MAAEYDLVILGGTGAGLSAAITAARTSRVALVLSSPAPVELFWFQQALGEFTRLHARTAHPDHNLLARATQYATAVVTRLQQKYSSANLGRLGIDVITGEGNFQTQPTLQFCVAGRQLRSHSYLIAAVPPFPENHPRQLLRQLSSPQPPQACVLLGNCPVQVELAQILARLQIDTTLLLPQPFLALEERAVALLLRSHLEAEGVKLIHDQTASTVDPNLNPKGEMAAHNATQTVGLVEKEKSAENWLNLTATGVRLTQGRLSVNAYLQTANPRIYACGEILGGYPLAELAHAEARVALHNALHRHPLGRGQQRIDYRLIPWRINTDPALARVGCTVAQARRWYSQDVMVLEQDDQTQDRSYLKSETTSLCQLVVRQNGDILGATAIGMAASEMIQLIALAMVQRLKVTELAHLATGSLTLSEICFDTASRWLESLRKSHN
uniref:FAD-dependent pyridine nucleotide-disulphide oxidoreductase n=1 Tax=Cyanothece sp. (strain PCC 7425 / ATCC 29141) TaxID=395961 RepID=B8HRW9_CYAP4